jgi:hypothetical protein
MITILAQSLRQAILDVNANPDTKTSPSGLRAVVVTLTAPWSTKVQFHFMP